jgi:benzylsuccinate CoA-transferase BbsF subunit
MTGQLSQDVLFGLRVLDFSWVLAGPFTTRLLADFGAEVIKIQPLLPAADDEFSRAYYNAWNRNKLGLSLDLSKPAGLDIARRLVKICDVVVENFSPRVMSNWGLDYAALQQIKPEIIFLSLSMMGHTGPWRDFSGFGPAVQAFSGFTYLMGDSQKGLTGPGYAYSDHIAGLYGALAVLGALEYRDCTGSGQYIDLAQNEAMISLLADQILDYQGVVPNDPEGAPQGVYRCHGQDRWCAITVLDEKEWLTFKQVLGCPDWVEERDFKTRKDRIENALQLDRYISEWTCRHSAEEVAAGLQAVEIAAEVVKNSADLALDAHLIKNGFFVHLEQSGKAESVSGASPIHLSETPARYKYAAPLPGQDNRYVLNQLLGLSTQEISELERDKVIVNRPEQG